MWNFDNIFVQFVKFLYICYIYFAEALIRTILANDSLNMHSGCTLHHTPIQDQTMDRTSKAAKPAGYKQGYGVVGC